MTDHGVRTARCVHKPRVRRGLKLEKQTLYGIRLSISSAIHHPLSEMFSLKTFY